MMRLGAILKKARGKESRVQFARKLELSYTFVRAMEHGLRFPSDKVLLEIASRLGENPERLLLAAYCDRSPLLAEVLSGRGVAVPEGEDAPIVRAAAAAPIETLTPQQPAAEAPRANRTINAHDPF
ncbi:MAG: transcriptional regulator with XRE-family HTH domain [Candidatus Paceibacteria bacterium]|jgi:transcriptional regulator with XRE-family HTH domain